MLTFAIVYNAIRCMYNLQDIKIENLKRVKNVQRPVTVSEKKRITFYKTKQGCYTPPPYVLKYRELSEVL